MYTAKATTRGLRLLRASFHARLRRRRELALELEGAVDRGELEVHFQPVIALADGSVHAFEALSRWRHPARGLLTAAEFIPVAEESGLIVRLGHEMLQAACSQAGAWQDATPAGRHVGLWVNVRRPSSATSASSKISRRDHERADRPAAGDDRGDGVERDPGCTPVDRDARASPCARGLRVDRRLRHGLLVPEPSWRASDRHAEDPEAVRRPPGRRLPTWRSSTPSCGSRRRSA